jgi:putative tricarboxylic transport membrane protein
MDWARLRSGEGLIAAAAAIPASPSYARVGPQVFPWTVSAILVLIGLGLLAQALTGRWTYEAEALPARVDWTALLWILIGLALYLATIGWAGFPIASALLFAGAARGFGSRRPALDLGLGLVLGAAVFAGFHYGLGLSLPAGILDGLL